MGLRRKNKLTIQDMDNMQSGLHQAYAAAAAKAVDPQVKALFETVRDNDMAALDRAASQTEASELFSKYFFALQEIEKRAKEAPGSEAAQLHAEVVQKTQQATTKLRNYLGL